MEDDLMSCKSRKLMVKQLSRIAGFVGNIGNTNQLVVNPSRKPFPTVTPINVKPSSCNELSLPSSQTSADIL